VEEKERRRRGQELLTTAVPKVVEPATLSGGDEAGVVEAGAATMEAWSHPCLPQGILLYPHIYE
jgi:hypothetical protein